MWRGCEMATVTITIKDDDKSSGECSISISFDPPGMSTSEGSTAKYIGAKIMQFLADMQRGEDGEED